MGTLGNGSQTVRGNISGCRRGDGNFDRNDVILNANWKCLHAPWWLGPVGHFARSEVNPPRVERANHISTRDDAVGKRTPTVWAFVFDGKEAIAEVEDGDAMASDLNGAALAKGNAAHACNTYPVFKRFALVHWNTFSIGSICTN
jgi:hypothetical protein